MFVNQLLSLEGVAASARRARYRCWRYVDRVEAVEAARNVIDCHHTQLKGKTNTTEARELSAG